MSSPRFFYGWTIVGAAFWVDFIAVGFFFYSYGVFYLPITEELGGGSRFGVAMGIALVNGVAAILAPWVGNALDQYSIKRIMAIGVCISALGFALLSKVQSMTQFYLVLVCLTAVGTGMLGQLATAKLVANWFVVRRGRALGIATMGVSLSGTIMPFVTTWLIVRYGWRGSLEIFSVATFVIVMPIVWFLVVDSPEDKNLEPDGRARLPHSDSSATADLTPKITWRDVLKLKAFWAVTISFGLIFCVMSATLFNLIAFTLDLGFSSYQAANILAVGAFAGVFGKIFFGVLSERADNKAAIIITITTQWIGIAMLLFVEQYWLITIASIIFGFGMGGVIPLHAMIISSLFGRGEFGKVMGLTRPTMLPLHFMGIPVAALIYDATGSYTLAFYLFLGFLIIAACTTWWMIPSEREVSQ